MKKIGFLSFGHWSASPYSQVRTGSDALIQSIELAEAVEDLGADGAYFRVHHFAQQLASPFPLLAAIGGLVIGAIAFIKTEVGGFWIDKVKLSLPIVKTMFRSLYISRSLQTMGQLINAGVPMLDTLAITGDISGNQIFKGVWRRTHAMVKTGKKITQALQKDNVLPRAVTQMISAGEESGKLGEVLDEISGFYLKQLREQIKAVTSMSEPIMILLMGTVVGFIAMAIILPIFKMSQIVR